jgi:hypothetical protein
MWSKETLGFMLTGVGLIIAAVVISIRTAVWMSRTKIAAGSIVGTEMSIDDEGNKTWQPVISFVTDTGARCQFKSFIGGKEKDWKTGDAVQIRYDPANPRSAAIDRLFYLFLVPLVLSFIGVIFAGIAIYLHVSGAQK